MRIRAGKEENSKSTKMFVLIFSWTIFFFCACSVEAADSKESLLRVPIFFVTDRNLISNDHEGGALFGGQRKYVAECKHDPYMGTAYCLIPNSSKKTPDSTLSEMGWQTAQETEKEGQQKASLIEAADFQSVQKAFFDKLYQQALKSKRKEIIVFVHGYKNSFASAVHTAARFSYAYECPVLLYSWPSMDKLRGYSADEGNNEWSQEHFNELVEKFTQTLDENSQIKLRIFAHSMGSRLLVRATPYLREKQYVSEAGLICPDIDQGLVRHYVYRHSSSKSKTRIRLYMSQQDKALVFSQLLHGGYCRLGECADSLASFFTPNFTLAALAGPSQNTSKDESHNAKSAMNQESEQDEELKKRLEHLQQRLQTIDFSELDRGFIGHKIPVELIYNMSYSSQPGPGLKLVAEASGQQNKPSRVLLKLAKLKYKDDELEILHAGSCLKVVKESRAKGRGLRRI